MKGDATDVISTHSALHREALAAKTLPCLFKEVLDFPWSEELRAEHSILLSHAGTRWFLGKVDPIVSTNSEEKSKLS